MRGEQRGGKRSTPSPTKGEREGRSEVRSAKRHASIDEKSHARYNVNSNVTACDERTNECPQTAKPARRAPTTPKPGMEVSSRDGGYHSGSSKFHRQKTIAGRPVDPAIVAVQKKREVTHRRVKSDAVRLWSILGNPVFDSPMHHDRGFIEDAILVAKRGRRCAMETHMLGSNLTKKKTRDFERSARRYGNEGEELRRLTEYPEALKKYHLTLAALQNR